MTETATGVPALTGPAVGIHFARFLRDPVAAAVCLQEQQGSLVLLRPPLKVTRKTPPAIAFAAGARFNQAVLGQPSLWRTVNILAGGKRRHVSRLLGRGLVQMNGPAQAYYRKLFSPALKKTRIEAQGARMAEVAISEIGTWPTDETFDLWPLAQHLMQVFAIDLLFGGDRLQGCPLAATITRILGRSFSFWAAVPIDIPGTPYHAYLRDSEICAARILEWAESKRGATDSGDLLSLLVNSVGPEGEMPRDPVLISQVPTLFGAAFETCQNALVWTLVLLALHPAWQRQAIDEIRGALKGGTPTFEAISALPLLDGIVKESFRLLPPVPLQYRVAQQDTELAGLPLPARTRAVLSPFLTNRDPAVYARARCFDPMRWRTLRPDPYAYTTFSGGPRVCPGSWFGTAVMKMAIAALLSDRAVVIADGARIDYQVGVTMSPRSAVPILLEREPAGAPPSLKGNLQDLLERG